MVRREGCGGALPCRADFLSIGADDLLRYILARDGRLQRGMA